MDCSIEPEMVYLLNLKGEEFMLVCKNCNKGIKTVAYSRHKKGSSGAGGTWALKAPIHKRIQKPNLHSFQGEKYCTKCLRAVKKSLPLKTPSTQAVTA